MINSSISSSWQPGTIGRRIRIAILATALAAFSCATRTVRADDPPPTVAPKGAEAPNPNTGPANKEQKVQKLLDYLESDYAKKTISPFWVTRGMGVISLARSPRPQITAKLLEILEKDKHEVVRLLAWQAITARAAELDAKQFDRLYQQSLAMAEHDMFKGGLRAPLLDVLACAPPSLRVKKIWEKIFTDCNAWESEDTPVLEALGACVAAWRSPQMVDAMIGLLTNNDKALRAEYVLHRAGSPVRTTFSTLSPDIFDPFSTKRAHPSWADMWKATQGEQQRWWSKDKADWKEPAKTDGTPWHALKPAFVAAPYKLDKIDPEDKLWYQDLELGRADLNQFEAAFMVDATGSMGDVLDWLKRDLGRMATAFQMICKEPVRTGITFYRDYDDAWTVKLLPLTIKIQTLEPDVVAMQAAGGGDIPEAILPALKDTIEKNKWTQRKGATKVIILIGDAPPHTRDLDQIMTLAKKARETGMKIHAAKVKTETGRNDLTTFDEIAQAAGGATVDVEFKRPVNFRFVDMLGGDINYRTIERPEVQLVVAPLVPVEPPGEQILKLVVSDAINPQYRNRVEPLARTLLAFCARPGKPEVRKPFPANTPALDKGKYKPQ